MALSRSVRFGLLSGCALVALAIAGSRLDAQQRGAPPAGQQTPPQFRATTDLVLVDVSVLDKSRKPVRGLTKADFTVLEDGVAQDVASFTAIDLPDAEVPSAKWMNHAPLDVQTNSMPDGRLILIYLDERQPTNDPFATKATKEAAHAIVDQLSPKDVASVAFMLDHRGDQEFTTDRARLHAAIDTFAPSQPVGVPLLGVLYDLSNLFVSIPERRKIIIYVGMGQPYDLEVLAGMDKATTRTDYTPNFYQQGQTNQYNNLMMLMQAANRANVSIYTIDPIGLDNTSPSDPHKEFLRLVANTTGARAVIGNNSPASQVPLIMAENASYYMLAFKPSNPGETGKFRRIEVKVNRPGVDVRARRGYVEGRTAGPSVMGNNPALGRLIPATQLSLGLWAQPAVMDPSGNHPVGLMVDVELPREGARANEHLAVAWSIVDMSGKDRGTGRQDLTVSPPAGTEPYVATAQAVANLPPGHYDIRVSAQLVERNRRGGLLGDVVVPDFAKDPLSTSGVFVGQVAPAASVTEQLARFLSVQPTTDRTFAPGAPIVAAMRVYQAKQPLQPVTVKASILDGKDKVVVSNSQQLEVGPFTSDGFGTYRYPLPLTQLGAGPFLLRLEVSRSGAPTVTREVRFAVK